MRGYSNENYFCIVLTILWNEMVTIHLVWGCLSLTEITCTIHWQLWNVNLSYIGEYFYCKSWRRLRVPKYCECEFWDSCANLFVHIIFIWALQLQAQCTVFGTQFESNSPTRKILLVSWYTVCTTVWSMLDWQVGFCTLPVELTPK